MANSSLSAIGLDPLDQEQSFVAFAKADKRFRDYDFEGSNLRALIRILGYNAWKSAFYTNMDITEAFLDSAQNKSSVVSRAKELNYVPRSARSATSEVSFTFTGNHGSYVFQKGQTFSAVIRDEAISFSIGDTQIVTSPNGSFSANLILYQGVYLTDTYVLNSQDETQRLVVSNKNVDTTSVTVVVFEDGAVTGRPFKLSTTLLGVNDTSKVFFIQQAETEQYEVEFGDGVVGYLPKDGSTVVIDYRVCIGESGNGARIFVNNFNPGPTEDAENMNVQTISVSGGGLDPEDIESIRYYAPRHFQVQERASADEDYGTLLRAQFPEIRNVSVYDGAELNPPLYRKVFVAVDIEGVDGIPESKKSAYFDFLKPRCPKTIVPVFVSPLFTYVAIRSEVTYDITKTVLSPDTIKGVIITEVADWAVKNINAFQSTLRYSRFCTMIDDADASIVGNQTNLLVYKKITPTRGFAQNIEINFDIPLYKSYPQAEKVFSSSEEYTFRSGLFTFQGDSVFLEDDGAGAVNIMKLVGDENNFVASCGTIDYDTGLVRLTNLTIEDFDGSWIKCYAKTSDKDIISDKNTILLIEPDEVQIDVRQVTE